MGWCRNTRRLKNIRTYLGHTENSFQWINIFKTLMKILSSDFQIRVLVGFRIQVAKISVGREKSRNFWSVALFRDRPQNWGDLRVKSDLSPSSDGVRWQTRVLNWLERSYLSFATNQKCFRCLTKELWARSRKNPVSGKSLNCVLWISS